MTKKKEGLEPSLEKLEKIVQDLESGDFTLEESLGKFEEGIALGKRCREILDRAEMRIRALVDVDDDGARVEEEFGDGA